MPFVQLIFCLIFTGFLSRCKECGKDVLFSVAKMRIHLKQKHRMMWAKYKKQLLLQGRKKRTKDSELAAASSDSHLQGDEKKVGDAASNSKDVVNASDDNDIGTSRTMPKMSEKLQATIKMTGSQQMGMPASGPPHSGTPKSTTNVSGMLRTKIILCGSRKKRKRMRRVWTAAAIIRPRW